MSLSWVICKQSICVSMLTKPGLTLFIFQTTLLWGIIIYYAPSYSSATDEDFYSSLAQMAGEDFDGDDDNDEVTKMGVCWVHACLQPNSLYRTARFANFERILGFSVPSIILADLLGNTFTCDWCILIHSVCFCVSRSVACDRPVSGNNQIVFFGRFFWSFLFLSLARIKQCLPPALDKNSTHHRDFLRYSWAVLSYSKFCFCGPSWVSALNCDLH